MLETTLEGVSLRQGMAKRTGACALAVAHVDHNEHSGWRFLVVQSHHVWEKVLGLQRVAEVPFGWHVIAQSVVKW